MGNPVRHAAALNELTYPRLLLPSAARAPHTVAFVDADAPGGHTETLGIHAARSLRIASALRRSLGLAQTDRFAVLSANSRLYANLWHASLLGGGIINPINTRLAPPEIEYILRHSESRVVFVDGANASAVLALRAAGKLPFVEFVVAIDETAVQPAVDLSLETLIGAGSEELVDTVGEDDPALLMYTGGTTGLPKGVLLSQRALVMNTFRDSMFQGFFRRRLKHLSFMPMFHIGATFAITLCCTGGTCHIQSRFDVERVIAAIEHYGIDHLGIAPTAIGMILNHPSFTPERLRTLRTLLYGASPMPLGFIQMLQETLPWVEAIQAYGMTEAGPLLTMLAPEDHRDEHRRTSAGRALPGVDLAIYDQQGEPLRAGQVGEVRARSGSLLMEYWRNPEATSEALRDGWYCTGDAGFLDSDGYLFLVDRVKDMIVSGGENVYSAEVENVISTYPGVAQVAVIGIPSAKWGEAVHAIVVARGTEAAPDPEAILEYCRGQIAGYKVPKSIEVRTEPLPLSGAMKALKRELRKPFWEGHSRNTA
jgi:long-chain acyl-CoA synthetase